MQEPEERAPVSPPLSSAPADAGASNPGGNKAVDPFYQTWLGLQCDAIAGATAGLLVLRQPGSKTYVAVASWPATLGESARMAEIAQHCLTRGELVILDELVSDAISGAPRPRLLFAHPIGGAERDLSLAAVVVAVDREGTSSAEREHVAKQLHWGSGWIEAMEWRQLANDGRVSEGRSASVLDIVALAGEHRRLVGAGIAIVNEVATRFGCTRASLGMLSGRYLRLSAISHSATFDRRSQFARSIESAMEEAFHQNCTVAEPSVTPDDRAVTIAHRELAKKSGAGAILSAVLHGRDGAVGVITLEREGWRPFDVSEARWIEAAAALLGPVLELQVEHERWVTGRGRRLAQSWTDKLTGPDHPTFKLAVGAAVLLPLILLIVPGQFRVSAKSVLEGQVQRILVAPYDGFIRDAAARAGDVVRRGDVLARLDDRDAELERVRWLSETEMLGAKYADAMAKHDRPNVMILSAQRREAQAQLALAVDKVMHTRITAPFDGVVVTGDLSQALGAPVERGKTLFEIAPLDRFRVVAQIDERDIRFVRTGQYGQLALNGMPADPLRLKVTKVTPVSTSEDGRNYYRVEAALISPDKRLRPGMEGIGRIEVGRRPMLWIWTRSLIDWVRIAWWRWLP